VPRTAPPRTLAILPVKSFGAAKGRLSDMLGAGARQALAQAMFSDVLASLRRVRGVDSIAVVTADRVAESAAHGGRVQVLWDSEEAGQSEAATIGIRYAVASGFQTVLLVPGDAPLLERDEVDALLARCHERATAIAIVPDRHGTGTNALVLSPPDAMAPSFGPGSFERHLALAREAGLSHSVEELPSLLLDVDTPEDLKELAALLEERRGQASMTRGALRQLDRLRTPPPVAPVEQAPAQV
jgi:2-phospho-L-lactate/phosphoenolpyruvate guanylyltransferase